MDKIIWQTAHQKTNKKGKQTRANVCIMGVKVLYMQDNSHEPDMRPKFGSGSKIVI